MTLGRILSFLLLATSGFCAPQDSSPQNPSQKKEDTFFAGTVAACDDKKIVVSRSVAAKTEQRTFRMTPATKVEGRLRPKVRVTVRYTTDEDGEVATLVVVRPAKQK